VSCTDVRHQHQEVGDADIHAKLVEQGGRLATMVGLLVKQMQQQAAEVALEGGDLSSGARIAAASYSLRFMLALY